MNAVKGFLKNNNEDIVIVFSVAYLFYILQIEQNVYLAFFHRLMPLEIISGQKTRTSFTIIA